MPVSVLNCSEPSASFLLLEQAMQRLGSPVFSSLATPRLTDLLEYK